MQLWSLRQDPTPRPYSPAPPPSFSQKEMLLSAGLLVTVLALCAPAALYLRSRVGTFERESIASVDRCRRLQAAGRQVEGRKANLAQLRRSVDRYLADVDSRPIVPWATAVSELSGRRPRGLRTIRISGEGPRFVAELSGDRADLAWAYAGLLAQSPYVDFANASPGGHSSGSTQVVGRMKGE
jgi:hypothetical protein